MECYNILVTYGYCPDHDKATSVSHTHIALANNGLSFDVMAEGYKIYMPYGTELIDVSSSGSKRLKDFLNSGYTLMVSAGGRTLPLVGWHSKATEPERSIYET